MKKSMFLVIMVLLLSGCSSQIKEDNFESSIETTETEKTQGENDKEALEEQKSEGITEEKPQEFEPIVTEYQDETENTITYGKFSFSSETYHLKRKVEHEEYTEFEYELNADYDYWQEKIRISIRDYEGEIFPERSEAMEYLASLVPYSFFAGYENIDSEETGLKCVYKAGDGKNAVYLINYKGQYYLIQADSDDWDTDLINRTVRRGFLVYEYIEEPVECAQDRKYYLVKNIFHDDNHADYELYSEEKELIQRLSLETVLEEEGYQYQGTVWDEQDNELQAFQWELGDKGYFPSFMDANLDGYPDIEVMQELYWGFEEYALYTWNETEQRYEKVHYDDILAYFSIEDGYLKNWIRSDGGYVYQELYWEGNTLVKRLEEYIEPDPEEESSEE